MNKEQFDRYIRRCQKKWFDEIDVEAPYEWKVFGTLKFQYFIGLPRSRRLFYRWLKETRKPVFPHFLNWFAVIEVDRWNNKIRIHVLIGGSQITYQRSWIARWQGLGGGDVTISDYRPGAFSRYVIDEAQPDHYFEVTMDLCGWGLIGIDRD